MLLVTEIDDRFTWVISHVPWTGTRRRVARFLDGRQLRVLGGRELRQRVVGVDRGVRFRELGQRLVGVDVPNATLMIVEHAERFGLSQLHQLRGRVGRGAERSFCVLLADVKKTEVAKERLGIMEDSNDGFVIAEKDLELRGQGDIIGTRQSGIQSFRLANIVRDLPILVSAKQEAEKFLDEHQKEGVYSDVVLKMMDEPRIRFFGVG